MRYLPAAAACLSFGLGYPVPAQAQTQFIDGNRLFQLCNAQDDRSQAICGGYILGVVEALRYDETTENLEPFACLDDAVTVTQLEGTVLDYLDDNPKDLQDSGASLVAQALADAFPCGD